MDAMLQPDNTHQKDLTERCLTACAEALAPIILSTPKSLGETFVDIARNEGWAVLPRSEAGVEQNAAFSAWILEIVDSTWCPTADKYVSIIDSITAALDGVDGGAMRVPAQRRAQV
jgi:hypothetical protein